MQVIIKMQTKHLWHVIALCLYFGSVQCVHPQDAYQLGEEALQYGNYEQAIRYLKNTTPTGKSLIRIGFAYSQLGRYREAADTYQKTLRLVRTGELGQQTHVVKAQAFIGLGFIAYQQGKFDDAIQYYTNVVEQNTVGVSKAQHNLGKIYAGRGEIEKAIDAHQHAISREPNFAEAYFHLGVLYSRKQDWQAAITALQKTVAISPTMPNTHYQLARCYRQIGDIQKAEKAMERFRSLKKVENDIQEHLEAVFSADTDNKVTVLIQLAYTYLKYERYEEAAREFRRISKYSTSDVDTAQIHAGYGRIALEQGDISEALKHYNRALQLGLKSAETYHYLGIAYMQNRDAKRAMKQFKRALTLNSDYAESHLMLGTLYTTDGKFDTAEKHYKQAISLVPEMAAAHHGLAYLYGKHNSNLDQAIASARKAVELSPSSAPYHNTLSWLCFKHGKYDAAEAALLKAIKLAPDNPVYQEGLKEIRQKRK